MIDQPHYNDAAGAAAELWPLVAAYGADGDCPMMPLDYQTIRGSGLLWKINHDLLHPLGLALSVGPTPPRSEAVALHILVANDGEWQFSPPSINDQYGAKFAEWYAAVRTLMDKLAPE